MHQRCLPSSRSCPVRISLLILCLCLLFITAARLLELHHGSFLGGLSVPRQSGYGVVEYLNEGMINREGQRPVPPPPPPSRHHGEPGQVVGQCGNPPEELAFLRRPGLDLTDTVLYTRRCITPIFVAPGMSDRDVVTNITTPLLTHQTAVNLTSCTTDVKLPPCDPLPLRVSQPYPKRTFEHFVFGVASTYDRLNASLPAFSHWLSGTGAELVCIVVDTTSNLSSLQRLYHQHDINATFVNPKPIITSQETIMREVPVEQHHFMLLRELLLHHSSPVTRWLAVIDDDTFFPSLSPLDRALSSFDPSRPLWLGSLSDDFDAVRLRGFMAYGGAGIFLSVPLARQLLPHMESCVQTATLRTGDGILRDCIYAHSRTKLTIIPGLYQHDMRGDASGFYESGVSPLSVHHWKSWYREPIPDMAGIAEHCGDCWLQRWVFAQDDVLLANGYSITQYTTTTTTTTGQGGAVGIKGVDLSRMEATWARAAAGHEFDFSYGPLRKRLTGAEKKSWKLVDAQRMGEGHDNRGKHVFRQTYVHRHSDGGDEDEWAGEADKEEEEERERRERKRGAEKMDEVIDLFWDISQNFLPQT